MAKVIANHYFKVSEARSFVNSILNNDNVLYSFFGQATKEWENEPLPDDIVTTDQTFINAKTEAIGLKRIHGNDISLCVPRYSWVNNTVYKSITNSNWDQRFYVVNDDLEVYICLYSPGTASTVIPTGNGYVNTADGYRWYKIFTVAPSQLKFLSDLYLPIKTLSGVQDVGSIEESNKAIQDAAVPGQILGFIVEEVGTGYADGDTVSISGDGGGAVAELVVDGGEIISVRVTNHGSGYSNADTTITTAGGSGAVLVPVISPRGLGADPEFDLGASFVITSSKYRNTTPPLNIRCLYRQIGLLLNPVSVETNDSLLNTEVLAVDAVRINYSGSTEYAVGDTVTSTNKSAKVIAIDPTDVSGQSLLYVVYNNETGYSKLATGNSTPLGIIDSVFASDYLPGSGEVLMLENRSTVNRSLNQIEDVRFIVQF